MKSSIYLRYFAVLCIYMALMPAAVSHAQQAAKGTAWVDSVFNSLSDEERIAQLMVIRTSAPGTAGKAVFYDSLTDVLVKQYNVGGVCLFQGTPAEQATLLNRIQALAKTPIMVTVDGEWGLGMRFAGVQSFPYQLTLGATGDAALAYRMGQAIAAQCRRIGIHVNYAPVVDINNNPNNPVIGYRSFGENRETVARLGTAIMQGMQHNHVMACAKHFPGHGDVDVDSHYDLPVIHKPMAQLNDLELYPFKALFAAGVGSVMIAHLYIPAIDTTANRATSLSYNNVTGLMRQQLGYQGLTFTDALEMKGVAKFFPGGEAAVQSLIAGNDMLCLPQDVPAAIVAIKEAIVAGRLSWDNIYSKCRRVLHAKYDYVKENTAPIALDNLTDQLNSEVAPLRRAVAERAFTLLQVAEGYKPVGKKASDVWMLQLGGKALGKVATQLQERGATVALYAEADTAALLREAQKNKYKKIIVSVQNLGRRPADKFGLSEAAIRLAAALAAQNGSMLVLQGNPYALGVLEGASFGTVAVGYEDDAVFQQVAFDWLTGLFDATGKLPVSIGRYKEGQGIVAGSLPAMAAPSAVGMQESVLRQIDLVAQQGIDSGAFPGCVVTVLRKGHIVFRQAYGHTNYTREQPVGEHTIYDLASVSKTSATTVALMHLYEQGKLDLQAPLSRYLGWLRGTDKANIIIEDMMLHQSGLVSFIPFYRDVIDKEGKPLQKYFRSSPKGKYKVQVTEQLYMHKRYVRTMYQRIKDSKLYDSLPRYVYSDNNYILLADVVKAISGQAVDAYMATHFFEPLGLHSTRYHILDYFDRSQVAPTEQEKQFRQGLLWGYVHDPGAAMFGNMAGHAGLFSNATHLATLYQMLLNGGTLHGKRYLLPETVALFTGYRSAISRRGYGWDKPEKGNDTLPARRQYPATYVSQDTYGHTGYTGTCVWVDPQHELVYVFLSNRVHPMGGDNRKLLSLNIRGRIHDIIYQSLAATP